MRSIKSSTACIIGASWLTTVGLRSIFVLMSSDKNCDSERVLLVAVASCVMFAAGKLFNHALCADESKRQKATESRVVRELENQRIAHSERYFKDHPDQKPERNSKLASYRPR